MNRKLKKYSNEYSYKCLQERKHARYMNIDIKRLFDIYTSICVPNFTIISQYLDSDNI